MRYQYFWLIVLLASCAPIDPAPVDHSKPSQQILSPQNPPPIEPIEHHQNSSNSAITELLAQAKRLYESGEHRRSVALAERAMRLNRYDTGVYWVLALNYVALENYHQAEQFIQHGLSLTTEGSQEKQNFSSLLGQIRAVVD